MNLEFYKNNIGLHKQVPLTVLDNAIAWRRLIDNNIATFHEICQVVGKPEAEVSKTLEISLMPYLVLSCLSRKQEPVCLDSAYAIWQVYEKVDEVAFAQFLHEVIDKNLSWIEIMLLKKTLFEGVSVKN